MKPGNRPRQITKDQTLTGQASDGRSGWAETFEHFPYDILLRKCGFHIVARAAGQEPIWERRGVQFRFSRALTIIRQHSQEDS
jgi:hypothetical protein